MKRATISGIILLAVAAAIFLIVRSRRRTAAEQNLVVVRVFRDNKSDFRTELDRRLYGFTDERHRTKSGKWIFVATIEPYDYRAELDGKVALVQPQLVILDSEEDTKLVTGIGGLRQAKSACGAAGNCPAFIPAWVCGDELDATKQVFDSITAQSVTAPAAR